MGKGSETTQWLVDSTHTIVYKRPDKGSESDRKLESGGRTYGTKKRPSRSKKSVALIKVNASKECAGEMLEAVLDMVISHISLSKKLVWCEIGDDYGWASDYAAYLVGVNDIAHGVEVKSKDTEIARLLQVISDMEGAHKKEIKKMYSVCEKRVKHMGDLAQTQVERFAGSLVNNQPYLMEQFITASNTAIVVAIDEREKDTSTIRRLASETFSQVMASDISVIEID